jgi:Ca2+:H+ antiporter
MARMVADTNAVPTVPPTARERGLLALGALLAVAVVVLERTGANPTVVFSASALSLMLLAWLLGHATEQVGLHLGGRVAGLLNATLGNVPELVVVLLLVRAAKDDPQLLDVARASILGSVLGNVLFVLGAALLVGGLRHGTQVFSRTFASLHATMLVLAVAAMAVPTIVDSQLADAGHADKIGNLSIAAAIVLLIVYAASIRFFLTDEGHGAEEESEGGWAMRTSVIVLVLSAVGVALVSEAFVGAMEHTIESVGISAAFMGFILVPIVGNVAEHLVAVQLAWRNDVDFSMTISLGSSIQVALALAPVVVIASHVMGTPLDLVFDPLQLFALGIATFIVPTVVNDGESTWIEGLQLLALYVLVAIGFWY